MKYTITGIVVGTDDIDLTANTAKEYSAIVLPPGNINDDDIVNVQDIGFLLGEFNKTDIVKAY